MTHDSFMTRPLAEGGADPDVGSGPTADLAKPRRRLGNWQTAAIDVATSPFVATSTLPGANLQLRDNLSTMPLGTAGTQRFGSLTRFLESDNPAVVTGPAVAAPPTQSATVPLPDRTRPLSFATASLDAERSQTGVLNPPPTSALGGDRTVDLGSDKTIARASTLVTAPIAATTSFQATRPIGTTSIPDPGAAAPSATRSTVPLPAALAIAAASSDETAPLPRAGAGDDRGDDTQVLLTSEEAQAVSALRSRVLADPDNSDALFELSVALHRAGLCDDARGVLAKLVTVYDQRGQQTQAARIRGMLGSPKTGPLPAEALSNRTPAVSTATAPLHRPTASLRNATVMIGRPAKDKLAPHVAPPTFNPEALGFTVPLPGAASLSGEARRLATQSDGELSNLHLLAAFDSCIQLIGIEPDYSPVYLRIAEIYTRQRFTKRARNQAEALIRLSEATGNLENLWMVYRVLLHASESDLGSLRRLVELLIESGQTEQASIYASKLIQLLDAEGLSSEALAYSVRLCELIPADTRAALENAILRLKNGDRGGAVDRWELAVAGGADEVIAKASLAAVMTTMNEDDHWRMLADVMEPARQAGDRTIVDACIRTAQVLAPTPTLIAGQGLLLAARKDASARDFLAHAAGDRSATAISRATASVSLACILADTGPVDEYVAAMRTAIKLLQDDRIALDPIWERLVSRVPRFDEMSLQLGEALLARGDAAGASDVLKEAHRERPHNAPVCERLAEAYFRIGQLGSALTVLDEMAVHFRTAGQLEAMAGVLRQMSQLAPNNIKVKSRLIDAYLQRGFVAEARAELVQRADLEERSGLIRDAIASLHRAADLSWTIGLADETFALYHRVIALAPDDIGNRSGLVNLYLQEGKLGEAAEHQRVVVEIALKNDRKHEAIAALHQVIGLTPDDTTAYYQLGDLLGSMGEYRQAEKVYRRLALMNPSDPIAQAKATAVASLREEAGG